MTRKERYKLAYIEFMKVYPFTTENLPHEVWKDIAGYEGLYQVSIYGRIKSFNGLWVEEKILNPCINHKGYLLTRLYKNGRGKTFLISRLVALTFIPNDNKLPEVDHVSGNKFDCSIWNLRWVTREQNMTAANKLGLIHYLGGEQHCRATLTNEQVAWAREVYRPYDKNFGIVALAKELNTSEDVVRRCIKGKTYKAASGTIHEPQKVKTKCPDEIATEIKRLYVKGSKEFGTRALAEKFGYNQKTILRIIHEND